jgi:hypothetical protein
MAGAASVVTVLGEARSTYRAALFCTSCPARRSRTNRAAPQIAASTSSSTCRECPGDDLPLRLPAREMWNNS